MYAKAHHHLGSALQLLGKPNEAKGAFLLAQRLDRPSRQPSPAKLPPSSPSPATPPETCSVHPLPRTTLSTTTASATTSAAAPTNATATPHKPATASALDAASELLVPKVAPASPQSLAILGDGLSHGHALEMQLAVRCAHLLGSPPWRLPIDVAVHRLVGPSSAHSAVGSGVLLPLTVGEQRRSVREFSADRYQYASGRSDRTQAATGTRAAAGAGDEKGDLAERASPRATLRRWFSRVELHSLVCGFCS